MTDATKVFDLIRQCAASCRATAAYAGDRGLDGGLVGKLGICADACELAQRAMDLGESESCEELCEAAAAACVQVVEACGAIAGDEQMAACAAVAANCAAACASMDTDGDMAMEPQVAMSDQGPRCYVRLSETTEKLRRIPIAILGSFVKGKQKFSITRKTLSDLVANFRKKPVDTVIDYDHASEFPEAAQGQPIPASGWIKTVEDGPDGHGVLWGHADFTDRAQTLIANKEYRYFSPVISWGARDKRTGEPQGATLVSGALTNRPFLEDLPAIAMSDRWKKIGPGDGRDERANTVKVKNVVLLDDRRVKVTMDDDTEAISPEAIPSPKVVRLSDVKRDKDGKFDFTSLPQDGETVIASEVFHGMLVQQELDAAVDAGKVTPAQRGTYEKLALSDLAGFRTLVASMKPQVDLTERGTGAEGLKNLGQVEAAIQTKVAEKVRSRPGLGYGEALRLVASENADLFALKGRLQKGGR